MVKKYLRRLVKWAMSSDADVPRPEEVTSYHGNSVKSLGGQGLGDRNLGMNFTVFNATGGKVVQFSSYDPIRDRHQTSLYIVNDREDLGEELAQIITKENLTR